MVEWSLISGAECEIDNIIKLEEPKNSWFGTVGTEESNSNQKQKCNSK